MSILKAFDDPVTPYELRCQLCDIRERLDQLEKIVDRQQEVISTLMQTTGLLARAENIRLDRAKAIGNGK